MKLIDDLLSFTAPLDEPLRGVTVGLHWTAVLSAHAGMAHTYKTARKVELQNSGHIEGCSTWETAGRLCHWEPLEASLGLAALNSLFEPAGFPGSVNSEILSLCEGRRVTVIGRFPFNEEVRARAGEAFFLETDPVGDELPSFAAEEVLPQSDLAVITATALINKSLPRLLELARGATAIVLGPSTPMTPILFDHGADILAGVRVTDPVALTRSLCQGVKKFGKIAGVVPIMLRK